MTNYYGTANTGCGCGCLILLILWISISTGIFCGLWNWLMPTIFNLPEITFWQGLGLIILFNFIGGCLTKFAQKKS